MFGNEKVIISDITSVIFIDTDNDNKAPKFSRYGPKMAHYELIYKMSGESFTTFNGKKLHNLPGTVEFLPKTEKADYMVERLERGNCIDIFFDTNSAMPDEAFVIDVSTNKNIKKMFEKVYHLWLGKQEGYYFRCMALLYEIMAQIQKTDSTYISRSQNSKIERGVEYLSKNYLNPDIDYYEPARLSEMSYTYFKRLFKRKYNVSPGKYVTILRIEYACELLKTGIYNISQISQACGFENVYYFSNVFKKHMGISPKNYKNQIL